MKNDVAREIARAIFENNAEALYKAYCKAALKGNAYAFKELSDRAYGKIKESMELSGPDGGPIDLRNLTDQDLDQQIAELERKLGLVHEIDDAGQLKLRNVDDVKHDTPLLPETFPNPDIPKA